MEACLQKLKDRIIARGGNNGIQSFSRVLKIMDDNGNKQLDKEEFKYGLQDYGVKISKDEINMLFAHLDKDRSGSISFDELLSGLRGPMPKVRQDLVKLAYKVVDKTGDGIVTVEDLELAYDVSKNPDVASGKVTKAEALREFLSQWDQGDMDGIVTEDEFMEYYGNVSASIEDDAYFELMIRNAWHISGGKGASACTTTRRVMVKGPDGRTTVQEITDDLGIAGDD